MPQALIDHWLQEQLESADKEVNEWPSWLRDQARFVGGLSSDDHPSLAADDIVKEVKEPT